MITSEQLRDEGFTLLESDFNSSTYSFPEDLDHGGYKLKVQESKSDLVQRNQLINVIDSNGILQHQSIHNLEGLHFFMKQFSKRD